jgi:hypothetical protein
VPVRADLIPLEAIMLFPADIEARNQAEHTTRVAAALDEEGMGADQLRLLAHSAAAALPLSQIHKQRPIGRGDLSFKD